MPDVGTAYVRIMPSTEGIQGSITKVLKGESTNAGESSGKNIAGGLSKGLKVGGALVATGAAALTASIVSGAKNVAAYGDNVDKMSQKIGISAKSYQQWDYVMARAGTSVDSLKMGMKTLSAQAASNSDAFQKLGISQQEVANSSKEELLNKTVSALANMGDTAERSALASQLLGRAGADMAPLFNQGTKAIEEQKQMALDYGMVMSDDMVKASADFEDSITTMQMTMTGLKNRVLGEFLPSMTEVTDGLGKLFKGDMSGLDDIKAGIQDFIGNITSNLPQMLKIGTEILTSLVEGIIQNLPALMQCGLQLLTSLGQAIISLLPTLLSVGTQMIVELAQGLITGIPIFLANINNLINQAIAWIQSSGSSQFINQGVSMISKLASGFFKALPSIIAGIATIVGNIIRLIVAAAPKLLAAGLKIIGQLAVGFVRALPKIIAAVAKVAAGAIKGLAKLPGQMLSAGSKAVASLAKGFSPAKVIAAAGKIVSGVLSKLRGLPGQVWNAVKSVPGKLAKAFKFKFSLPKLPKVHVTTKTGFMGVKYPVLSWNAKGGVFTGPTIVGNQGFGEAGPEYVLPLNKNSLAPLASLLTEMQGGDDNDLITVMRSIDAKLDTLMRTDKNVYLDKRKLVGAIGPDVEMYLGDSMTRRRR